MFLLTLVVAAGLAAASPPIVNLHGAGRARAGVVVALAVPMGALLAWASAQVEPLGVPMAIGAAFVGVVLAVQTVIDVSVHRLPRRISHIGLAGFVVAVLLDGGVDRLPGLVIGLVVMTAVTGALVVVTRGSLGIGDLHLSPLLGAVLGWIAPSLVGLAWVATALSGGIVVAAGLATRRVQRSDHIPYGPFMILGSLVAIVIGGVSVK